MDHDQYLVNRVAGFIYDGSITPAEAKRINDASGWVFEIPEEDSHDGDGCAIVHGCRLSPNGITMAIALAIEWWKADDLVR